MPKSALLRKRIRGRPCVRSSKPPRAGVGRLRAVEDDERDGRALERALRARDALGLEAVRVGSNAGRIDESNRYAVDDDALLDRIARRARDLGDDGALRAQQRVEQRRFSGIRRPDDCDAKPFTHDFPELAVAAKAL